MTRAGGLRRAGALVIVAALIGGCAAGDDPRPWVRGLTADSGVAEPARPPGRTTQPGLPEPTANTGSTPGASSSAAAGGRQSGGWTVTVYYTAVESFHSGHPVQVTGCPRLDCTHGDSDLGRYPSDFVQAVQDEGTGRTRSGRYLNWSFDTGYWLDDAPRDTAGRVLRPYGSAAADPNVLAAGTRFTIVNCGHDEEGGDIDGTVCDRLRRAQWTITDEFTPGLGGDLHIDAYVGEENGPGFIDTSWYTTLVNARVRVV